MSRCSEVMMGWTDGAPFPCHDLLAIMSTVEPDVLQEYATKPADDKTTVCSTHARVSIDFLRSFLQDGGSCSLTTSVRACAGW